jgi:hypothetical protein
MDARSEPRSAAPPLRDALKRHDVLSSGALCGIAGGAAMVGVSAISATSEGLPATHALQVIGESFVGPEALAGAAKLAFGAIVHLVASVALGILCASIIPRDFPGASAIGAGVGFGLFALMFMMILVVPWANPGFRWGMQAVGGSWVIAHAVFGVALGMAPSLRTRLVREERPGPAPRVERRRPLQGPVGRPTRTT